MRMKKTLTKKEAVSRVTRSSATVRLMPSRLSRSLYLNIRYHELQRDTLLRTPRLSRIPKVIVRQYF